MDRRTPRVSSRPARRGGSDRDQVHGSQEDALLSRTHSDAAACPQFAPGGPRAAAGI